MRNDERRFRELITPHLDDAYRVARWLTGTKPDAEDVTQEAALKAFRAIGTLKSGASARSWFLTIVRNTAISQLSGRKRPEISSSESGAMNELENKPSDDPTPEVALIEKIDAELLHRAIDELPQEFREVLVLREIAGLSYREISAASKAPMGTVMSRLSRARDMLAKAILALGGTR